MKAVGWSTFSFGLIMFYVMAISSILQFFGIYTPKGDDMMGVKVYLSSICLMLQGVGLNYFFSKK